VYPVSVSVEELVAQPRLPRGVEQAVVGGVREQGRDLPGLPPGQPAAYLRDLELALRVHHGVGDELVDVELDLLQGYLVVVHARGQCAGRYGVRVALHAHALAEDGPVLLAGDPGGTAAVDALLVAAEHEDHLRLFHDPFHVNHYTPSQGLGLFPVLFRLALRRLDERRPQHLGDLEHVKQPGAQVYW